MSSRSGRIARLSLRLLIGVPVLLLIVLFALSNTQPVRLRLWPTDLAFDLPLSIAILGAMALAFLLGAFCVWLVAFGQRRRIRRAEALLRRRDAEIDRLQTRLPPPLLP